MTTAGHERLAAAVSAFLARDLRGWRGLPESTPSDLGSFLPFDPGFSGSEPLGNAYRDTDWVAAIANDFPDGVRVWVRDGSVVMLDAQRMELAHPAPEMLAALGPPSARLDAFLGPVPAPGGAWVYPDRGLTLYVGGEGTWVDRVLGYRPVGLDEYLEWLHPHTRVEPLPDAGDVT